LSTVTRPRAADLWPIARRPRWVAALALALLVAAGFAALGQWQLERSIASGTVVPRTTETVLPLEDVVQPQQTTTAAADGQSVTVGGRFVNRDWMVVADRLHEGQLGFWVVGHLVAEGGSGGADLAVALGWAETERDAASALDLVSDELESAAVTVAGRYVAGEPPQSTDLDDGRRTAVSPPELVNEWSEITGRTYGGYLIVGPGSAAVVSEAVASSGLVTIDAPAPEEEVAVNWLNVFYAVEWVVFAGFAIFMWYRLVRDAWERETELAAQAAPVN
jgi:cytochrome oxidase assembly protein ShyY1